ISSITLENLIMGHPAVQEAAVIAVKHAKWDERPLLLVVPKPGASPSAEEILGYYDGKVAKWWIPDAVEFVDELPHTATGKLWKADLKKRYRDRVFGWRPARRRSSADRRQVQRDHLAALARHGREAAAHLR